MSAENIEKQISQRIGIFAEQMQLKGWMFSCAESCTGGLLAKNCTDLSGSSRWFDRAYVTYSNEAKIDMLDVAPELIAAHGAVSEQVAEAMVRGMTSKTNVNLLASITGIAGPEGGTTEKPVGTVCFAFGLRGHKIEVMRQQFSGDREQVRLQSVLFLVDKLLKKIELEGL
jgi:nicotinamide-nucleotide amidase